MNVEKYLPTKTERERERKVFEYLKNIRLYTLIKQ